MCGKSENEIEITMIVTFLDHQELQNMQQFPFSLDYRGDALFKSESGIINFDFDPWGKRRVV